MAEPAVPSGIDLHPEPESGGGVGKRVLLIGGVLAVIVAASVIYAFKWRAATQIETRKAMEESRPVTPATVVDETKGIEPGLASIKPHKPSAFTPAPAPITPPAAPLQMPPPQQVVAYQPSQPEFPRVEPPPPPKPPTGMTKAEMLQIAMDAPTVAPRKDQAVSGGFIPQMPQVPSVPQQQAFAGPSPEANPKLAFLANAQKPKGLTDVYLPQTRNAALGPYEIKAGWNIPGVLEHDIDSDLPGGMTGIVSENVYDSITGDALLIPQLSRLIGTYNSMTGYGDTGIQCVWDRIIFPDGSSISLDGMIGTDARGRSGQREKVDRHYRRLFGTAALASVFALPLALVERRQNNGYPSVTETATSTAAREVSQTSSMVTRANLNVRPTVKIAAGYRFTVRVGRDIFFAEPYRAYDNSVDAAKPTVRRVSR